MLAEGATFAAYEVRQRLAAGGMGEVYLCRHRVLDRLDAVKVLRAHLAGNEDFRRRFLREALSAARLRHPNVVTIYTADEYEGQLYLAMEYVAGDDLATLLDRGGRITPARTVHLVRIVADALDAAHRAHLVHRDIKPSNLLVTDSGTAAESITLVDFGISRVLDADVEITRTGEVVGTIAYSAPEQLGRGGQVGGACDQYALGCVAYECLTGEVPFPRESQLAIMTAHLTAPPPRASAMRPDLPAAVDAVLARAMAKDPAHRYPSCIDFAAALAAALGAGGDDHPLFPGPEAMATRTQTSHRGLVRPAADLDFLTVRIGWSGSAPMTVPLLRTGLAVRGEPNASAAVTRWILAQAATRHDPTDLCLAAALAPAPDENWLWVNWLAHARPRTPPLSGPHYATTPEAAADLIARLREVVALRRSQGTVAPRVLAVLDESLGVSAYDPGLAGVATYGVHVVSLARPGWPPPAGTSTFDLAADLSTARLTRAGGQSMDGVPDSVGSRYVRDLAELLPEE